MGGERNSESVWFCVMFMMVAIVTQRAIMGLNWKYAKSRERDRGEGKKKRINNLPMRGFMCPEREPSLI